MDFWKRLVNALIFLLSGALPFLLLFVIAAWVALVLLYGVGVLP